MVRTLLLLSFVLGGFLASGQVSLTFYLFDGLNGQQLEGVEITTEKTGIAAVTTRYGVVSLKLPQGFYHFHFSKPEYEAQHLNVRLSHDTAITVTLNPTRIELNEVIIEERLTHASNRETSIELETLDAQTISRSGANNFSEALSQLPGLNTLSTGVGIAKPVIRGLTGNRVQVVDNGVRQEGQQWGLDHGLEIDGFRVQRVEVIKGPAAIQYGSDATGGVVNILPEPVPEKGIHGTAAGVFKSNNKTRAGSLGLTYRKNQWYAVTRFSAQRYNDYHVPATEFNYNGFVLPITDNRLLNTGGRDWNLQVLVGKRGAFGNAYFQLTHFNQMAGIFPGAIGIPRFNDLNYPEPDGELNLPMQSVQHTRVIGHLNRQLMNGWLEVDAGWQYNKRQELSPAHSHGYETLDPGDSLALQMLLQTFSLRATYHTHLANEIELTTGLNSQYQINAVSGFEYLVPDYTAFQAGAFAFARKEIGKKVSINVGIRADGATLTAMRHEQPWYKDPDSLVVRTPDIDRDFLNLAVAGGVNYNPSNLLALKFNYSRTFRIPSIAELGANGVHHGTFRHEVGNPDLNPERAHQFDAGMSLTLPSWFIKVNGFFNYFNNVIYLSASGQFSPLPDAGQLYIYTQDRAIHTGFELYAEYHPVKVLHLESTSEYVHTYNLNTQTALPFTPPFMQQFRLTFSGGKSQQWQAGFGYVLAAAQNNTDRNEPPTPGYNLLHAHAGYTFALGTTNIEISLIGRNLLNTAYLNNMSRYRILNLPEQGRNLVVQVGMSF